MSRLSSNRAQELPQRMPLGFRAAAADDDGGGPVSTFHFISSLVLSCSELIIPILQVLVLFNTDLGLQYSFLSLSRNALDFYWNGHESQDSSALCGRRKQLSHTRDLHTQEKMCVSQVIKLIPPSNAYMYNSHPP